MDWANVLPFVIYFGVGMLCVLLGFILMAFDAVQTNDGGLVVLCSVLWPIVFFICLFMVPFLVAWWMALGCAFLIKKLRK